MGNLLLHHPFQEHPQVPSVRYHPTRQKYIYMSGFFVFTINRSNFNPELTLSPLAPGIPPAPLSPGIPCRPGGPCGPAAPAGPIAPYENIKNT